MNTLTIADAAYIAAFTDGEGNISLSVERISKTKCYHVHFKITNTRHSVLYWMQRVTGLGSVIPVTVRSNCRSAMAWTLKREEVEPIIKAILPYLKIKKEQAELMLEFLSLPNRFNRWDGVPDEIDFKRQVILEEMAELNKRGV